MSRTLFATCTACAVLATTLASPARGRTHPHDRNGFMIGFSVGGGSQGIEDGDEREGSVTGNLRVGYAVRPDLVLHFEGTGWAKTFDTAIGDATWSFSSANAALTCYPGGGGAFLRGGIGVGTANFKLETSGPDFTEDWSGIALLAAVGYEWRLTKKFAMGPHGEYVWMDLGDDAGTADNFGGGLDFDWYW